MGDLPSEKAWAAAWIVGHDTPFILAHTTRTTRAQVVEYMGEAWAKTGEGWRAGWKRAYRHGCRAIHVRVSALNDEGKGR